MLVITKLTLRQICKARFSAHVNPMLDRNSEKLLAKLQQLAPDGYTVLQLSDIADGQPSGTPKQLQGRLSYLRANDYIDVKYRDKDKICLCLTTKAASYFDTERNRVEKAQIADKQLWLLLACVFAAAFSGAFLATIVSGLL